ncbi:MAG: SBBP repeat-containing protein, partial [Candidatus Hydrothermales bacterium]
GKLVAYKDGEELEVSYEFEDEEIGFAISGYNGKGNLVIDPQLLWATYYGGDEKESNPHVSVDNNNNVYVVGYTQSTNFPTYNPGGNEYFQGNNAGNKDAFILKFNSKGDIQWATYYGGSGNDEATSISIDSNNNVYVVGHTSSTDFPVYDPGGGAYFQAKNAGSIDTFILKFDQNGRRLWATYYGGRGKDYATCISIDEKSVCANRAIDPCKVEIERCITLYIVGYTDS